MMDRNKQGVVLQKEKTFLATVALKGTRCSQAMLLTLSDRLLFFHQLPTAIESSFTIFHTFKLLLIAVWSVVFQGKRNGRWTTTLNRTFYFYIYFFTFCISLRISLWQMRLHWTQCANQIFHDQCIWFGSLLILDAFCIHPGLDR